MSKMNKEQKNGRQTVKTFFSRVCLGASPILTYILLEFYIHNPFLSMYIRFHFLNLAFFVICLILLWGICGNKKIAALTQTGFGLVWGLANYYVYSFRGNPILPWDIFSIKTAFSVAGNYSYSLEKKVIIVVACFVLLLTGEAMLISGDRLKIKKRLVVIAVGLVMLVGYVNMVWSNAFVKKIGLYDKLFTPTAMLVRDGTAVSFIMETEYLHVKAPQGYSRKEEADKYSKWLEENESRIADNKSAPNIIVIMNEAFSDLSVLGDFGVNEDYMPFVRELMTQGDNTVAGLLNVSVLGGNTADTEYEFLTGNSMSQLPEGCIPYQQFIKSEMPSLASMLKRMGYATTAIHPYNATGWSRDKVYPLIGFDEFVSIDDFDVQDSDIIRKYVSDKADYEKIISLYENKQAGPLFVFNVTMQNHGGYDEVFKNFEPKISIDAAPLKATNTYLSLVRESDDAFKMLVEYFENVAEDTVIVMFGDHQPATNISSFVFKLRGINTANLDKETESLRYKVPFVIWTNFDSEEEYGVETSANYLARRVLDQANIKASMYPDCLYELENDITVLSAISANMIDKNTLDGEVKGKLDEYEKMAYYLLFDY